jgi:predicted NAD/FAD-dependent oxidoreductase
MSRIAVIGGGISGLSAARALVDAGQQVVVFEKAAVPGGRMATRVVRNVEKPRGTTDLVFDHGAQYFTARAPRFAATVEQWQRDRLAAPWTPRLVSFDGDGWEEVAPGVDRYVGLPGMSAIANALAGQLDVRYSHNIESLDPLLREFDRVIVAVPSDQARALVAGVPALEARLAPVRMKPCWAVLAAFDETVAARFDAAFVSGSALGWMARNQSKSKRDWKVDTWVLHATTTWSAAHADDEADLVGAFLMEAFEDLVRAGLPRAFYATAHRWRYAVADPPLALGAIHDAESRITVCGDWCAGSRIEDAFLSGLAASRLEA